MARFGLKMMLVPGKAAEAVRFAYDLRGIPHWTDCWPVAAFGNRRVETVRISRQGQTSEIECDYLACGFHLIPNVELPRMCGCRLRRRTLLTWMSISRPQSPEYSAPENPPESAASSWRSSKAKSPDTPRPIGKIAPSIYSQSAPATKKLCAFCKTAFPLRPELKNLARPDTLVCRCEDVPHERLCEHSSWRAAKLHARCGMGPCQGRVCAPAAEFLFGWQIDSVRPPLVSGALFEPGGNSIAFCATKLNGGF